MFKTISIMALFSLMACSPQQAYQCPPLVSYPKEYQQAASTELKAAKAPKLTEMMTDYRDLRAMLREAGCD